MNVSDLYQTGLRPAELLTRLIGRAFFFGVGLVHVASLFFLPDAETATDGNLNCGVMP